jgi:4-amino-4-deoxy-L-arabinose transferase-like glycosyltransferase
VIDANLARRIRLVGLDVDGTLTDGGIYLGLAGSTPVELKRYDIQDGLGVLLLVGNPAFANLPAGTATLAAAYLVPAALAALAAFSLPTLERSVAALVDWFTLLFFTGCALIIWVVWIAMQTGFPPQPAANVARLAPGFEPRFVILPFIFATLATLAWGWLVRWRVGRHRAAIWKSLVLPAGGAALCWLLLTTLWMPVLDHARSYAPLVRRIEAVVAPSRCIETFGLRQGLIAAFQFHSDLRLEPAAESATCQWLVVDGDIVNQIPEVISPNTWTRHTSMGHPREGEEDVVIYQRIAGRTGH